MADLTKIEWCDATLNLWWGCTKVSEGCKHCYADAWSKRHGRAVWGPNGTRLEVKSWRSTLAKVSKRAKAEGRRLRVFVQSMSDTFEGPETMGGVDSENWKTVSRLQDELLKAVLNHPELDFLLLTKRPENVLDVVHRHDEIGWESHNWKWPSNAWAGTSVEDQETADERIQHLLNIPAKVRFLSCEPLLGPVDLTIVARGKWDGGDGVEGVEWTNAFNGINYFEDSVGGGEAYSETGIHWVIVGGESGPNARPMHPDWARSLRDQCVAAGVPFFFKQWGEFLPQRIYDEKGDYRGDQIVRATRSLSGRGRAQSDGAYTFEQVGKKVAGRVLDGRTWDEFPEVTA